MQGVIQFQFIMNEIIEGEFPMNGEAMEQIDYVLKALKLQDNPKHAKIKKMSGGITNVVYKFESSTTKAIVRVYGRNTDQIIDRNSEIESIKKINFIKILSVFPNGMICSYQEGRPIDVPMMGDDFISDRVAPVVAKLHSTTYFEPNRENELFDRIDNFINRIDPQWTRNGLTIDIEDLRKRYLKMKADLELEMSTRPTALCHNDLLAGNILWDGENIGIIDYEYSGYTWPEFDIANHFVEWCGFELDMSRFPSIEKQRRFIKIYLTTLLGSEPDYELIEDWRYHVSLLVPLSGLFWGTWGYFQAVNSTVDFPYYEWAKYRVELSDYELPLPEGHPLLKQPLIRIE